MRTYPPPIPLALLTKTPKKKRQDRKHARKTRLRWRMCSLQRKGVIRERYCAEFGPRKGTAAAAEGRWCVSMPMRWTRYVTDGRIAQSMRRMAPTRSCRSRVRSTKRKILRRTYSQKGLSRAHADADDDASDGGGEGEGGRRRSGA